MGDVDNASVVGVPQRPWRRSSRRAEVAGVCAGLSRRLGVAERSVRVAWSISVLFLGLGLVAYVIAWLVLPRVDEPESIGQRLKAHRTEADLVALGVIALSVILDFAPSAGAGVKVLVWSGLVSALGVTEAIRHASAGERTRLNELSSHLPFLSATRGWRALVGRVVPGVVLVLIGLNLASRAGGIWAGAVPVLLGSLVVLVGVAVSLAPWWLTTVRELTEERRSRIRAEERAVLAAQVHDSVLQTLSVIERSAADRPDILSLVREESRELRDWLFHPERDETSRADTLSGLLRQIQDSLEKEPGGRIEVVTVSDAPASPAVVALSQAVRELALNALRWSGTDLVHVFAEVDSGAVTVFVRDTGRGFDPSSQLGDGLRHSVLERVERVGGTVTISSQPGSGTDVRLYVPR